MSKGSTTDVSKNSQHISEHEKLRILDEDLMSLYEFCKQASFSTEEMDRLTEPLFSAIWQAKMKIVGKKVGGGLLTLAAVFCLLYVSPLYTQLPLMGRHYLIKVLPYWDWTRLYYADCFISNPFFVGSQLVEEDCSVCEPMDVLDRLSNVSHQLISDEYLKVDLPFIVTDAMDDWNVMNTEQFWFDNITELYLKDEHVKSTYPCSMSTNLRLKNDDVRPFLRKIHQLETKGWFGHWENCNKKAAKALRHFYSRPYFLPAMVDLTESNWVFLSSNYKGKVYKKVSVVTGMLLYAQVRGYNHIRLTPKEPCHKYCPELTDTLVEGEMLVFTDFMWKLEYIPGQDSDNVAFAAGGHWD